MSKCITDHAKSRYSTKRFDKSKKISPETIEKIKILLRYSASSTNLQGWHFVLVSSSDIKNKVAKSTENFPFNTNAILDASHVLVFCSKTDIDEKYLLKVLEQEDKNGRYDLKRDAKDIVYNARKSFVNLHKNEKDLEQWLEKQVYLNLGTILLGLETLGVNALTMEGFDRKVLNQELNLTEKGLTSVIILPIGYKTEDDFNASLPKSRLEYKDILTEL